MTPAINNTRRQLRPEAEELSTSGMAVKAARWTDPARSPPIWPPPYLSLHSKLETDMTFATNSAAGAAFPGVTISQLGVDIALATGIARDVRRI
jgi:hypothetical protein